MNMNLVDTGADMNTDTETDKDVEMDRGTWQEDRYRKYPKVFK
jgi:hypothetical protein